MRRSPTSSAIGTTSTIMRRRGIFLLRPLVLVVVVVLGPSVRKAMDDHEHRTIR
jgi:hypothetical protein